MTGGVGRLKSGAEIVQSKGQSWRRRRSESYCRAEAEGEWKEEAEEQWRTKECHRRRGRGGTDKHRQHSIAAAAAAPRQQSTAGRSGPHVT